MLEWIDIKDFVIAKHVELEFADGLSVITGETGAGKSIFINALSAVLGNRVDSHAVRHGCDKAEIQASFALDAKHKALDWLKANELDEDDQCLLRRVIPADKSSRAFINGRAVSATVMRELGTLLVDIHGQHEHQSLLKPEVQQTLLDHYGQCRPLANEVKAQFKAWQSAQQTLDTLNTQEQDIKDRLELIDFQLNELQSFAPEEDEWANVEQNHKQLHHAADVQNAAQQALLSMSGSTDTDDAPNALDHINLARHKLESIKEYAPLADNAVNLLNQAETLINEAQQDIDRVIDDSQTDPEQLDNIEARYSLYHHLARKYQTTPEQLFFKLSSLQQERERLTNPEAEKTALQKQIEQCAATYKKQASSLSKARKKAAKVLSKGVSESMQELGMQGGEFDAVLESNSTGASSNGDETVSFKVMTNPGFPAQALSKIASGGELSRISLAIQVLLAEVNTVTSLVFDEVDVGVGGQTAAIVGKLLKKLAAHSQILCITHLPQVAARGDAHYQVVKSSQDDAQAVIEALSFDKRVSEIARMVGGEHITDESLAHAKNLIEAA